MSEPAAATTRLFGSAARVDADSIASVIRLLSTDESGAPGSRYAERPETRLRYAPAIRDLFARYLAAPDSAFLIPFESSRTDTAQTNVMAIIHADGPSNGLVLLTAHYDATGKLTPEWDAFYDPAPGADDNASGVACLVEAARLLPALDLPFDVGLVAFGSEEAFGPPTKAPLEGSRVFARGIEDSGELLLGVLNCDMIAYNTVHEKVDVVTNASSLWLADRFAAIAAELAPDLEVKRILAPSSGNSDHASFWALGEDAVLLIENQFPDQSDSLPDGTVKYLKNPFYHTKDDTLENLNLELARAITGVVVGTIAGLAQAPDGAPDLVVDSTHIIVPRARVFVGDAVDVEVRVFNRGGVIGAGLGSARVELWRGDPGGGSRMIGDASIDLPIAPWFYKRVFIRWSVGDADEGAAPLFARVTAGGISEATLSNNDARLSMNVLKNEIRRLRTINSPARVDDAANELRLDFEVSLRPGVPQDVEADIYDASGRRIAEHPREPAKDGRNSLFLRNFRFGEGRSPNSGVYFAEVRLFDRATSGLVSSATGKFVLIR
ncbi:MAG: M28 family metallopeptidase [bacterium]